MARHIDPIRFFVSARAPMPLRASCVTLFSLAVKGALRLERDAAQRKPGWVKNLLTKTPMGAEYNASLAPATTRSSGKRPLLEQRALDSRFRQGTRSFRAVARLLARRAGRRLGLHREQAFALHLLARQLAGAANGFGLFAGALFGRLFIMTAQLHFAENALTLHLLLERLEGLIDIVVANENLHACILYSEGSSPRRHRRQGSRARWEKKFVRLRSAGPLSVGIAECSGPVQTEARTGKGNREESSGSSSHFALALRRSLAPPLSRTAVKSERLPKERGKKDETIESFMMRNRSANKRSI